MHVTTGIKNCYVLSPHPCMRYTFTIRLGSLRSHRSGRLSYFSLLARMGCVAAAYDDVDRFHIFYPRHSRQSVTGATERATREGSFFRSVFWSAGYFFDSKRQKQSIQFLFSRICIRVLLRARSRPRQIPTLPLHEIFLLR